MQRTASAIAITLLLITAAWAASAGLSAPAGGDCLTRADVERHLDRSRHGISLTCNEAVRQSNLARTESGGSHADR